MARYKPYDLNQLKMVPLSYADQIAFGSFEHALNEIVEEHLDLSVFDKRYINDETGRLAYDPRILLKIVLYGYYKGLISSRRLAEACRRNVVFMALSADCRPHFTTIAAFVSELDREIAKLFGDVLLMASELGLIGREHFAVDGCKLPSNASKRWSGTHKRATCMCPAGHKLQKWTRHASERLPRCSFQGAYHCLPRLPLALSLPSPSRAHTATDANDHQTSRSSSSRA